MIDCREVTEKTADTLVRASTVFRPDQIAAYKRAAENEESPHARWVLNNILENAEIAESKVFPLCDDTGIPHLFLEVGEECVVPSGALAMAPIQTRHVPGKDIRLTVMMYGGGPEIRGKTLRVFHKHSVDTVIDEMIAWGAEGAKLLGCLPCVLVFGIGRSNYEAASLGMEAMAKGNFLVQSEMEKRITDAVNESGYGALGLGGKTTVLGTFVKVGPQRASGIRVVSMRLGCCFDPRRAECLFEG